MQQAGRDAVISAEGSALAAAIAQLGLLFHASANEAPALQIGQFSLFRLQAAVLLLLCEQPTGGGDLSGGLRCRRRQLRER